MSHDVNRIWSYPHVNLGYSSIENLIDEFQPLLRIYINGLTLTLVLADILSLKDTIFGSFCFFTRDSNFSPH
jgi:hypothetical protein